MSAHRVLSFILALCAVPVGAQTSPPIVELRWSPEGRFAHRTEIQPKGFVEVCGELSPRAVVAWSYNASEALDFNIHYHLGKDVVYAVQPSRMKAVADKLTANVPEHYCWMWVNKGESVATLSLELRR
ncbi:MAG: hypothetical protein RI972_1665 [Pseudomonadota bacterium]